MTHCTLQHDELAHWSWVDVLIDCLARRTSVQQTDWMTSVVNDPLMVSVDDFLLIHNSFNSLNPLTVLQNL